jgi:outer membrane autotransporter protein
LSAWEKVFEPFAVVSVVNEFLGGETITTDQTNFNPTLSGASVQAGAGLNAALSKCISIYMEYDYANGNRVRSPWAVDAGLRWQW